MVKRYLVNVWSGKHIAWRVLRGAVALPILGLGVLMCMEKSLIYHPTKYDGSDDWSLTPVYLDKDRRAVVEDVWFTAEDDTKLHGWYFTPHEKDVPVASKYVVLFCHGNAGNITDRRLSASALCRMKFSVFSFDYRGFGRSEGAPGEEGICRDARAAWDELIRRGWKPSEIIILGISLGGGPAVELATQVEPAALVTQSTFTSIPDMASVAYPFVPKFLVRTQFNNLQKIEHIKCPKLLIHGTADDVIPCYMGERLAAAADGNSEFVMLSGAGHNDIDHGGKEYVAAWDRLLKRIGSNP